MRLYDITALSDSFVQTLHSEGIETLNAPQRLAVEHGLLNGNNLLVASPTASGKTLIAAMAMSQWIAEQKKSVYVVPLRSLGSEKYNQLCEWFGADNVGISMGDYDTAERLSDKQIIILTVEKFDSLLRHGIPWLSRVGLVVFDEIHLLNDVQRGPTLEMVVTRLRDTAAFQLVALSATVQNASEIADWLQCTLVESDYRPVRLHQGVIFNNKLEWANELHETDVGAHTSPAEGFVAAADMETEETDGDSLPSLYDSDILNCISYLQRHERQAIVFTNSRKSTEAWARRIAQVAEPPPNGEAMANDITQALSTPTTQCKELASCIRAGVAFHHAGLVSAQRQLVEEQFLNGAISYITATPTLAMGVSLPSYAVIMKDVKRFGPHGMDYIPTMEYAQMTGRAGRPEHHSEGIALAYAADTQMKQAIYDRYIHGTVEPIYSKLGVEPVLRFHIIGLIASSFGLSQEEIFQFFSQSLYAHQYGDVAAIQQSIQRILDRLQDYGFVRFTNGEYVATSLGERTAELYIDPETVLRFLETLTTPQRFPFLYLYTICACTEMKPLFRARKKDRDMLLPYIEELAEHILVPAEWDYHFDTFLEQIKTAVVCQAWMDEWADDSILDTYGITPGVLRAKLHVAEWLLYSMREIARIKQYTEAYGEVERLRLQLKHGVQSALLSLVRYKGIGRKRARQLYNKGIRSASDLQQIDTFTLSSIIGASTAKQVKSQLADS